MRSTGMRVASDYYLFGLIVEKAANSEFERKRGEPDDLGSNLRFVGESNRKEKLRVQHKCWRESWKA